MITDNHELQILHLFKDISRYLLSIDHFQLPSNMTYIMVHLNVNFIEFRLETYSSLFPTLKPRQVIQLGEKLLIVHCKNEEHNETCQHNI